MTRIRRTQKREGTGRKATRRNFLRHAAGLVSGAALAPLVTSQRAGAQSPPVFLNPPEIVRRGTGILRAVMQMADANREVPNLHTSVPLRYFQGWDPGARSPEKKPKDADIHLFSPGPTLRAHLGDRVEITFLNKVNRFNFPGTVDAPTEMGRCDTVRGADPASAYPLSDKFPNCFHGSNTANIHFHGMHVNPDGLGDNVLIQVIPEPEPKVAWDRYFEDHLFNQATIPQAWQAMPRQYRDAQQKVMPDHAMPWPEHVVGAFPNFFDIPKYRQAGKYAMGQSPGTHWYHAHKHGSTALHIQNGLAGVFIVEDQSPDGYDGRLRKAYPNLVERVLIFQTIDPQLGLEVPGRTLLNPSGNVVTARRSGIGQILVNGKLAPEITMRPGEIQLWRLVNATLGGNGGRLDSLLFADLRNAGFELRQIAQDGVQLSLKNYQAQPDLNAQRTPAGLLLDGGNRVDLLVKAPASPKSLVPVRVGAPPPAPAGTPRLAIFQVTVAGSPVEQHFIADNDYPPMPSYLSNLHAPSAKRTVRFDWGKVPSKPGGPEDTLRTGAGRDPISNAPPRFTIDGKQFAENGMVIDQCVKLGETEDWNLENWTTVAHPFHIHVNPFQVIEVEDPVAKTHYRAAEHNNHDPVWQDVVVIPAGVSNGTSITPGRVTIRHHFADFTGTYVLHCHILGHEDRGMMQLVRVVPPASHPGACQVNVPMSH